MKNVLDFAFPSTIYPFNKETSSLMQNVLDKLDIKKMSDDDQTIFFLEFARVLNLRVENRLKSITNPKKKDKIFLEEIKNLAKDLLKDKKYVS